MQRVALNTDQQSTVARRGYTSDNIVSAPLR